MVFPALGSGWPLGTTSHTSKHHDFLHVFRCISFIRFHPSYSILYTHNSLPPKVLARCSSIAFPRRRLLPFPLPPAPRCLFFQVDIIYYALLSSHLYYLYFTSRRKRSARSRSPRMCYISSMESRPLVLETYFCMCSISLIISSLILTPFQSALQNVKT